MTRSAGTGLRARIAFHSPGLGFLGAFTIWLMHRFIFTGGIPAGTDMLGFISRSSQYASLGRVYDSWAPSSFGFRHAFSFDNILGAITLLTHSPMLTVKLLDVLTLFGAGLCAYALAWSWYRRRPVAAAAGLLYMTSQAVLTRWGSGQLNVEIIISAAPLMLLTWSLCLERFTVKRAVGFTFTMGLGFLVRADLVLYVAPFLVLYAAVVLSTRRGFRERLTSMARTLAIAVPGVLLLNAAWLLPLLTGYRVQYETLSQIFKISQLTSRSLVWDQSLLGLGREIGYFDFTGMQTWQSYPWLPVRDYYLIAALVPLLACAALWRHRDRRSVFLALAAVIATLAAPGTRPPLGGLYLWAAQHIPVFGNLRDPNRWLIAQAIAYSVLASLTIDHVSAAVRGRLSLQRFTRAWARPAARTLVFALMLLAVVPVLPTLATGLRTWHVTPSQQALLDRVRKVPSSDRVFTIPSQDVRFLVQGTYKGYEHDLGYESVLFTGRQDLGDGAWDQRSANFVAYQVSLLKGRNPALPTMLASVGVSRVVSFHYPLNKVFITHSLGPYTEQRDASKIPGLTPVLSNPAGTDYSITGTTAPLSFRRNIAVVLGGSRGVAALADQPGIKLSDWAIFTADDVIETQGYPELLSLIRKAGLVLLANERPLDIAVEGTMPLAKVMGITSDPQVARATTDVPTDQSAQTGSLTDPTIPIPQPLSTSSSSVFSVRSPKRVEIWARVLASPQAATIRVRVDGARVGSVTPMTLGHGFEWVRVATLDVGAGTHRLTLSAVPSRFGDSYEVQEARVLDPRALASAQAQLNRVLAARASRVAYDFNLADVAKWSWKSVAALLGPTGSPAFSLREWTVPKGTRASRVSTTTAPGGATAPQFTARAGRRVYTFAEIYYKNPQNWAGRAYVYLQFKGTGSGKRYQLIFDTGRRGKRQARYAFVDNTKGWTTLAFPTSLPGPGSRSPDWARVQSVRIAAISSTRGSSTIALGVPRPSAQVRHLTVPLPIVPGTRTPKIAVVRPACVGGVKPGARTLHVSKDSLALPVSSLNSSCSIYIGSQAGFRQFPATPVSFQHTGTERWSYSFSAPQSGVLVWTQAYDPLWRLSGSGVKSSPLPVMSLLDGYLVGPGQHSGTISFDGESSAIAGFATTVLVSLLLLSAVFFSQRRRRLGHPRRPPPGRSQFQGRRLPPRGPRPSRQGRRPSPRARVIPEARRPDPAQWPTPRGDRSQSGYRGYRSEGHP